MGCLCLFWGALFRQNDYIHNLGIIVVDFDGQAPFADTAPFVGPFVTKAIEQLIDAGGAPGYTFHMRRSTQGPRERLRLRCVGRRRHQPQRDRIA
jgi:hypothetical protein